MTGHGGQALSYTSHALFMSPVQGNCIGSWGLGWKGGGGVEGGGAFWTGLLGEGPEIGFAGGKVGGNGSLQPQ